jgi:hypothetical protein
MTVALVQKMSNPTKKGTEKNHENSILNWKKSVLPLHEQLKKVTPVKLSGNDEDPLKSPDSPGGISFATETTWKPYRNTKLDASTIGALPLESKEGKQPRKAKRKGKRPKAEKESDDVALKAFNESFQPLEETVTERDHDLQVSSDSWSQGSFADFDRTETRNIVKTGIKNHALKIVGTRAKIMKLDESLQADIKVNPSIGIKRIDKITSPSYTQRDKNSRIDNDSTQRYFPNESSEQVQSSRKDVDNKEKVSPLRNKSHRMPRRRQRDMNDDNRKPRRRSRDSNISTRRPSTGSLQSFEWQRNVRQAKPVDSIGHKSWHTSRNIPKVSISRDMRDGQQTSTTIPNLDSPLSLSKNRKPRSRSRDSNISTRHPSTDSLQSFEWLRSVRQAKPIDGIARKSWHTSRDISKVSSAKPTHILQKIAQRPTLGQSEKGKTAKPSKTRELKSLFAESSAKEKTKSSESISQGSSATESSSHSRKRKTVRISESNNLRALFSESFESTVTRSDTSQHSTQSNIHVSSSKIKRRGSTDSLRSSGSKESLERRKALILSKSNDLVRLKERRRGIRRTRSHDLEDLDSSIPSVEFQVLPLNDSKESELKSNVEKNLRSTTRMHRLRKDEATDQKKHLYITSKSQTRLRGEQRSKSDDFEIFKHGGRRAAKTPSKKQPRSTGLRRSKSDDLDMFTWGGMQGFKTTNSGDRRIVTPKKQISFHGIKKDTPTSVSPKEGTLRLQSRRSQSLRNIDSMKSFAPANKEKGYISAFLGDSSHKRVIWD